MGLLSKKNKKAKKLNGKKGTKKKSASLSSGKEDNNKFEPTKADYDLKDLISPDGIKPDNNSYLEINDFGNDLVIRTFYISEMPNNANFADTFASFLNFPDSEASVHIRPLDTKKASSSLDKDVLNLSTEEMQAAGSINQERKLAAKIAKANEWANRVENNIARLSEVAFLISIYADTVVELNKRTGDLYHTTQRNSLQLVNCYGYQYEAYLANSPINNLHGHVSKGGFSLKPNGFRWHRMDQDALSCVFNHTTSTLYHEEGIYIAYSIADRSPIIHDLYDVTHKGYGASVVGTTGGGKSLLIKLLESRYLPSGFRFVSLDSESPGKRGEFSTITEKFGGVNYYFAPGSKHILNLFEIEDEEAYDETTGHEWMTLELNEKITETRHKIMAMVDRSKNEDIFRKERIILLSIINDIVQDLYREIGLVEGDPDSLYENSESMASLTLSSGRRKKKLPVFSDFFTMLIRYKIREQDLNRIACYNLLISGLKEYVKELNICHDCGITLSLDKFSSLPPLETIGTEVRYRKCEECHGQVEFIVGTQPYYDGESTIKITDAPIVNFDISQLNENEQPIAQAIALSYIKEKFIKKNAMNPLKTKKLGVIFDEVHKTFHNDDAREVVIGIYRIARKRYVAPITATQSIADYSLYPETEAIIKNSACMFVLAHKVKDIPALKKLTELDDAQIANTVTADVGECYIIDDGKAIHAQIDYISEVEAEYLETDIKKLRDMRQQEIVEEMEKESDFFAQIS